MTKWFVLITAVSYALSLCLAEMDCWDYLVSGPQGVPDAALSASSYHDTNEWHYNPACGRLYMYGQRNSSGCPALNVAGWCSSRGDPDPYIQVEFSDLKKIVGVVLQQRHLRTTNHDIRTYQVQYSKKGQYWEYFVDDGGNQTFYMPADPTQDNNIEQHINTSWPVLARFVRIRPLTWVSPPPAPPCFRFDVIGCTHDTGRRRFAYLPLPAGSIRDVDVITQGHAKDLGECSLRCHRDVTCRSFSYSDAYKNCKEYSVNKYNELRSRVQERSSSEKHYLYYFDMTNVDMYMKTDPTTGLIYKVITRKYSKEDAMKACEELDMRLLVVNSEDKLNLLGRVKSSSLILEQGALRVSGGWYKVDGMTKWWDGGDPPQPINPTLVVWNPALAYTNGNCLVYYNKKVRRTNCTAGKFSICEI